MLWYTTYTKEDGMVNLMYELWIVEKLRHNRFQLLDPTGNVKMIRNKDRIHEIYDFLKLHNYQYQEEF